MTTPSLYKYEYLKAKNKLILLTPTHTHTVNHDAATYYYGAGPILVRGRKENNEQEMLGTDVSCVLGQSLLKPEPKHVTTNRFHFS